MTLTQLAEKHNIDPVAFRLALQEWIDGQEVIGVSFSKERHLTKSSHIHSLKAMGFDEVIPLIAKPTLD